jgi:DNA-binding transcriptional LysR family regulator
VSSVSARLGEVRLADLATFLAIRRAGSITGAAREMGVTPSQVSKAVGRIEAALGVQLLSRASRSVALSDSGKRVLPHFEAVMARLLAIGEAKGARDLSIAGPSFLLATFLPAIQVGLPSMVVRGMELPPALLRAYSGEDFFDMGLLMQTPSLLPPSWQSVHLGDLPQSLFGSPALARRLGPLPVDPDHLREVPFVSPVYFADGHLVPADDDCPLGRKERVVGHQVLTIILALELAARTDQLVFGPCIAARKHVATGSLVEIPVRGWNVQSSLHLACNGDRVLAKTRNAVADAVRATLEAGATANGKHRETSPVHAGL